VRQAGGVDGLPMTGGGANGQFLILSGAEEPIVPEKLEKMAQAMAKDPARSGYAEYRVASAGYFPAMGIPLLRGRLFAETDAPEAPQVAVISQSLAAAHWPDRDPLGAEIEYGNMDGDLRLLRVVGVVGDVRDDGLASPAPPTLYVNFRQRPRKIDSFTVVLHAADPLSTAPAATRLARELEPGVSVLNSRTVEQVFSGTLADRRFSLILLSVFGACAMLLAVMGIYGVMAYSVARRTQEFGIRVTLGARPGDIRGLVLAEGTRIAAVGLAAGLAGAAALTRVMAGMLFEIAPSDPVSLALALLLLAGAILLACMVPARQATRVDPIVALRAE